MGPTESKQLLMQNNKKLLKQEKHRTYYLHYLQEQRVHLATTAAPRIVDKHTTHISAVLKTGHAVELCDTSLRKR